MIDADNITEEQLQQLREEMCEIFRVPMKMVFDEEISEEATAKALQNIRKRKRTKIAEFNIGGKRWSVSN